MVLSRVALASGYAVASEHLLASLAGHDALRSGGNAVDAAVATSFTLAVTQPSLGGIGGDFFALFYEAKTERVHCINSSGWAPSGLSARFLEEKGYRSVPAFGPLSIVVPGMVKGVHAFHRRFGKLEFKQLLSSAIDYARKGFAASQGLSNSLRANLSLLPDGAREIFAPTGDPPNPGDLIRQENLGRALEAIAQEGPEAFYKDWIAESICNELSREGLPITMKDFAEFEPEWVEPLHIDYRGITVYEIPPNSMGATTLLMLRYLQQIDLKRLKPNSRQRIDLFLKAAQAAYDRRDRELGDPRFTKFDEGEFFDVERARSPLLLSGPSVPGDADTTYFAVTDQEGNIVSAIQSLFHHFGSRVFIKESGVFLSNRGSAFRLRGPNKLEPKKRPLHTLSALLLGEDEPTTALGCSGGSFRPQQHTLLTTNMVDYSMSLEDSIDFPRFLWDGQHTLSIERGYSGFRNLPFEVRHLPHPGKTGVAQGVQRIGDSVKAVCDARGDGFPIGR